MKQPPGFVSSTSPDHVCKLRKALSVTRLIFAISVIWISSWALKQLAPVICCILVGHDMFLISLLDSTCLIVKPLHTRLSGHDGDPLPDPTTYRSLFSGLQYLTLTRPDIAFSVNQVCQFLHQPHTTHMIAAKRILRFVKGAFHLGLTLHRSPSFHIRAYSDANWAGDPDDRCSTADYRCSTAGWCMHFYWPKPCFLDC